MEKGPRLRVTSDKLEEPGFELMTPGYKASGLSTKPWRLQICWHAVTWESVTAQKDHYPTFVPRKVLHSKFIATFLSLQAGAFFFKRDPVS